MPVTVLALQLFGERLMIANASGCSSVWGGTATTNPYTRNKESGRGPAWGRSLFEDNAEYGLGMYLGNKQRRLQVAGLANDVLEDESVQMSDGLRANLAQWVQYQNHPEKSVSTADAAVASLAGEKASNPKLDQLYQLRDMMPYSSQWIIGGDGWAYDIGYGGVDWVRTCTLMHACVVHTRLHVSLHVSVDTCPYTSPLLSCLWHVWRNGSDRTGPDWTGPFFCPAPKSVYSKKKVSSNVI